jgi:hypothetical protein
MNRELLQQALDAFESIRRLSSIEGAHIIAKNARYGLREELAKLEREEYDNLTVKFGERAKEYLEAAKKSWQPESHIVKWSIPVDPNNFGEPLAKPEQEPIAQIRIKNGHWIDTPQSQVNHLPDGLHDLYTAPPRKPWQGLTDEQLSEIYNDLYTQYTRDDVNIADFILIARTIELLLKEKNT